MKRLFAMIAFLLTSTLAAPAPGQTLSGQWCGEADQDGPGDYRSRWSATLVLNGPAGRMDYPSLGCGGTLTFERAEGRVDFYRERIDYGGERCIDGGLIGVQSLDASVRWEWNGSGATATAVLSAKCQLHSEYDTPESTAPKVALRAPSLTQSPCPQRQPFMTSSSKIRDLSGGRQRRRYFPNLGSDS
jgi:hypothetical protein